MKNCILAIDIGGSKLLVGIISRKGEILEIRKTFFDNPTSENVIELINSECREILKSGHTIDCAGVSIPGLADSNNGLWLYACFSKIKNLPIASVLEKNLGCKVFIENDANICAFGEKTFGCAKDIDSFIWITISNGIGSGLYLNNQIYDGKNGNAGEIGHIRVVDYGDVCPCGGHGCLEAYAAGPGIARRYRALKKYTGDLISAKEISLLAENGEEEALQIYNEVGYHLGKAIACAINIINVDLAVIGGGISQSYPLFEKSLKKAIREFIFTTANPNFEVRITDLGYEASLVGAAAYAMKRYEQEI